MAAVRILVSGIPPNSTPASPLTAQTARSIPRHPHPRSPRSYPEAPAALHSPLKPERSAIGAVIRPRFPLSALHPAQRHYFIRYPQLSTPPHTCHSSRQGHSHSRTNHAPKSPANTKTRTLSTPHVNIGPFSPAHQPHHLTPGPFLSAQPTLRSGRLRHSSRSSFASPATSTAAGNTKTRTTRLNKAPAFGVLPSCTSSRPCAASLRLDFTSKFRDDEHASTSISS